MIFVSPKRLKIQHKRRKKKIKENCRLSDNIEEQYKNSQTLVNSINNTIFV